MAQRAIRECDGKKMLSRWMQSQQTQHTQRNRIEDRFVQVTPDTPLDNLATTHPWLQQEQLVVKPDQLIKRRGKSGLILLEATWQQAQTWIRERMGQPIEVEGISGILDHFIIEPFTPHAPEDEYYLAIRSTRDGDEILFYHEGGIHVGDVDAKAARLLIPIGDTPARDEIMRNLVAKAPEYCRPLIAGFVEKLFRFYAQLHYTYLEINPFVVVGEYIVPLDMAARIDDTAEFVCGHLWGTLEFPAPFGRNLRPEEKHIVELDAQTGASLKLTILNPHGRVWTMVAGGGASVIYADTVTDLGFSAELANYGEYSGDPSEQFTCDYARTILDLMTREEDPRGKVLIIGGGIANFTDVASTFKGIVRALKEYKQKLIDHQVKIYVRRGGPNYQEGLRVMRELGQTLGVPIAVYGPETHITSIVPMALEVGEYAA
jgi:ATP citrate (pro-S)-lyase